MPIPVQTIFQDSGLSTPAVYDLPPGSDWEFAASTVRVNGAGASGTFIVVLDALSQDNRLVAQARSDQEFAVGDTGVVSFAPFLRRSISTPATASAADFAVVVGSKAAPGAAAAIPWSDFERTSSSIFATSVTDGGAISNTTGDEYLRCEEPGVYHFSCMASWSGNAIGQRISQYVSNGSSTATDDNTARARTPIALNKTTSTVLIHVNASEAPVWAAAFVNDGGSGNNVSIAAMVAAYWPAGDRSVVY